MIDRAWIDAQWQDEIVPQLVEYIRIPNKSPAFDADWAAKGHMERAVAQISEWCEAQPIEGLVVEVVRLEGRTPLIYMEVPGANDATVLLYGHLDKQPEMTGWRDDLGPWLPVLEDDKLFGRGGADDGYAAFASLTAIAALQRAGIAHGRLVVLIEADEESGSEDLPFTSITLPSGSVNLNLSSVLIRDAATTTSCGRRRRCVAWWSAS